LSPVVDFVLEKYCDIYQK